MNLQESLNADIIQKTIDEQRYSVMGFSDEFIGHLMSMGVDPGIFYTIFLAVFFAVFFSLIVSNIITYPLKMLMRKIPMLSTYSKGNCSKDKEYYENGQIYGCNHGEKVTIQLDKNGNSKMETINR